MISRHEDGWHGFDEYDSREEDDRDPSDERKRFIEDQMVEDAEYRAKYGVAGLLRLKYLMRDGGVAPSAFWVPPVRLPPLARRVHLGKARRVLEGEQMVRLEEILEADPTVHTVVYVTNMSEARRAVSALDSLGKGNQ